MLAEAELRMQSAAYLQRNREILNNDGEHWVKAAYKSQKRDGGEYINVYCMMGGMGAVLIEKIQDIDPLIAESLDHDDYGDLTGWNGQLSSGLSYVAGVRLEGTEKERLIELSQVWELSEIALAWASWKYGLKNELVNLNQVIDWEPSDVEMEAEGTSIGYEVVGVRGAHDLVTMTNDADETGWNDIVAIHDLAIEGLHDKSCPLTWEEAGKVLLEKTPDELNLVWNPKRARFEEEWQAAARDE
jgi:hypothetical protein